MYSHRYMGTTILICLTLYSIPNSLSLKLSCLWASEIFYHHFIFEVSKAKLGIIPTYLSSISTNTNAFALPMFCCDWNFMMPFEHLLHPSPTNLCQMSSIPSFSNLSLPFNSYFRPSSGTMCLKSGYIQSS